MKQLFKPVKPNMALRVYKVENINPEKNITSSLRVSDDRKNYVVCLCLPTKTTKTVFHDYSAALLELKRVRELYRPLKKKHNYSE